jgi:hypothetical protein
MSPMRLPVNVVAGLAAAAVLAPAALAGDKVLELPSPCLAPIVFVTSPGGAWFAVTGG